MHTVCSRRDLTLDCSDCMCVSSWHSMVMKKAGVQRTPTIPHGNMGKAPIDGEDAGRNLAQDAPSSVFLPFS